MSKYRIYELAKEFNTSSKTILDVLERNSFTVKNHMSSVGDTEKDVLVRVFAPKGQETTKQKPTEVKHTNNTNSTNRPNKINNNNTNTNTNTNSPKNNFNQGARPINNSNNQTNKPKQNMPNTSQNNNTNNNNRPGNFKGNNKKNNFQSNNNNNRNNNPFPNCIFVIPAENCRNKKTENNCK